MKKTKQGKITRHKARLKRGIKQGFGKPWSAPSEMFRVEFSWFNEDGSEENEQTHWIECRHFIRRERKFLKLYYSQSSEEWTTGETLESKFVCVYCAYFLSTNKEKLHLNQCFVFPTPKKNNETIRYPIYQIKWSPDLAKNSAFDDGVLSVLRKSIWHDLKTG